MNKDRLSKIVSTLNELDTQDYHHRMILYGDGSGHFEKVNNHLPYQIIDLSDAGLSFSSLKEAYKQLQEYKDL